jgi:hypothetical protein
MHVDDNPLSLRPRPGESAADVIERVLAAVKSEPDTEPDPEEGDPS